VRRAAAAPRPRSGRRKPAPAPERAVLVETRGGIATITLNRPEVRNAINADIVRGLGAALDALAEHPETRVLILTGAGGAAFASGADLRELRERRAAEALRGINSTLFLKVERFPRPTVAAVRGVAFGGGCELALACDLRVAGASARFGQPEAGLGILAAAGAAYRLPRLVGWGMARELILTGRIVDAEEALRIGLVNRVVPDGRVLDEARALAETLAAKAPLALRAAKLALLASQYGPEPGHVAELLGQAFLFESADRDEGIDALLEKRRPRFTGR
jgi:enoyl-CoA hydratase